MDTIRNYPLPETLMMGMVHGTPVKVSENQDNLQNNLQEIH